MLSLNKIEDANMKAIEIENLNKIYNNRVQALSDVSFYVSEVKCSD